MRALARNLGVAAPSLYWHFRTREQLVADIVRTLAATIDVDEAGEHWADRLYSAAHSIRNGVFEQPELLDLLRGATSATSELGSLGIRFLRILEEGGLSAEDCVRGARLLNWQLWGFILHEARLDWPNAQFEGRQAPHVYEFPLQALSGGDLEQVSHLLPHLARLDADELFDLAIRSAVSAIGAFAHTEEKPL